jgi:hypothetical protein
LGIIASFNLLPKVHQLFFENWWTIVIKQNLCKSWNIKFRNSLYLMTKWKNEMVVKVDRSVADTLQIKSIYSKLAKLDRFEQIFKF